MKAAEADRDLGEVVDEYAGLCDVNANLICPFFGGLKCPLFDDKVLLMET
jgi:hypothetical protein